jgi:hypothetical protein
MRFLAFLALAATPSRLRKISDILLLVVNGSEALAVVGRDTAATWLTLGKYCCEFDRSRQRLLDELQNGLRYQTVPPGRVIDWHDSNVQRWLDVKASEVSFYEAREQSSIVIGPRRVTVGIEVLPPGAPADVDVPPPSAEAPAASPAPNDGAGFGYQAARVDRALDRLEAEGRELSDYTATELRRLALTQIPEEIGFAPPSRQTLDRVIRRRAK